ncbi:hypothetical protein ACQP1P_38700 [Dactylosporangium sp. CA-052675]|uniref:hypothetical protein n=1 Tax=Dactylosporangium sp. CA-052675 TaxID=3239927 RepID=UPI003D9221CA
MADDRCTLSPDCELGHHAAEAHPCGQRSEQVGESCRYCGDPIAGDADGRPISCPRCWVSLDGMHLADIKGLLALGDLSVSPAKQPEDGTR